MDMVKSRESSIPGSKEIYTLLTLTTMVAFVIVATLLNAFVVRMYITPKAFLRPRGFVLFWQTQNAQLEERRRVWDASYT